ncbi:MAG: hypothetical protein J7M19_01105 [Planctomycetes bacterium]|nr:hypothetical protein [Planctomycetota bacterium]
MRVTRLIRKEIAYRKLDFVLAVSGVAVAVACVVAVMTLLEGHDVRLAELAEAREQETLSLMREVQDDYRVIMKELGYNLLILHKDEDKLEFLARGYASRSMPESFIDDLAASNIVLIRHLLPMIQQKVKWPERQDTEIVLVGVRGEVPFTERAPKEPMMDPVQPGMMRLGNALAENFRIKEGDVVGLMGKAFRVARVHERRGNVDDITVWVHLSEGQELLGKPGEINAIMALSCICVEGDLPAITAAIQQALPETQVIELSRRAAVRLKARKKAAALGGETAEGESRYHARTKREREALAAWLVPLVVLGCGVWVGLLMLANVRERRGEIAVLRAVGSGSVKIVALFLGRGIPVGVTGALVGYVAGFALGALWLRAEQTPAAGLFNWRLPAGVLVVVPLLVCLVNWIPAVMAAQQDPAEILRKE